MSELNGRTIQLDGELALKTKTGQAADAVQDLLGVQLVALFTLDEHGFDFAISACNNVKPDFVDGLSDALTAAMKGCLAKWVKYDDKET